MLKKCLEAGLSRDQDVRDRDYNPDTAPGRWEGMVRGGCGNRTCKGPCCKSHKYTETHTLQMCKVRQKLQKWAFMT